MIVEREASLAEDLSCDDLSGLWDELHGAGGRSCTVRSTPLFVCAAGGVLPRAPVVRDGSFFWYLLSS